MKLFCKIRHHWSYEIVKIPLSQDGSAHINIRQRICKRCLRKQSLSLISDKWEDVIPSKIDIRDKKLNDLGI